VENNTTRCTQRRRRVRRNTLRGITEVEGDVNKFSHEPQTTPRVANSQLNKAVRRRLMRISLSSRVIKKLLLKKI
jgi:hypothetical protein